MRSMLWSRACIWQDFLRLRASRAQYAHWDEMIEWLHCFLGVAHCAQGQTTLSLQFYTRGLEAINHGRVGDAELKLLIYKGLADEYFALARYEEAIGCYQKALAEVQNSDNKRQHGLTAWGLARAYQQQGDVFRAKSYYRQALQILGKHGNLQLLAQIRALYGLALIDLEDFEEAERQLQLSLDGAGKVSDSGTRGMALTYFAFITPGVIQARRSWLRWPVSRSSGRVAIGEPRASCSSRWLPPTLPGETGQRLNRHMRTLSSLRSGFLIRRCSARHTRAMPDLLAKQGRLPRRRIKSWRRWAPAHRSQQGSDEQCTPWRGIRHPLSPNVVSIFRVRAT